MSQSPLTIDIWSDVVCPFCFLGWRRLEEALKKLPEVEQVVVNWHAFQLNPDTKPEPGIDIFDYLAKHKNQTRQWAEEAHKPLIEQGKALGIDFNFDDIVVANTAKAHELIKHAEQEGMAHQIVMALFRAYFIDGQDLNDSATLLDIAQAQGLKVETAQQALTERQFLPHVKQDIDIAYQMQVSGVPFIVLNRKLAIAGAQPTESFEKAIKQVMA